MVAAGVTVNVTGKVTAAPPVGVTVIDPVYVLADSPVGLAVTVNGDGVAPLLPLTVSQLFAGVHVMVNGICADPLALAT